MDEEKRQQAGRVNKAPGEEFEAEIGVEEKVL